MVSSVELTDQTPPTKVAIKEPLADSQTIDTDDIQAFLNEADTWKTVDCREREKPRWKAHEHIVGVVDTEETIPWVATDRRGMLFRAVDSIVKNNLITKHNNKIV